MKIDGKNYNFDEPQNNIGINEVTRNNKNLKSIFAYFDKNKDNKLCAKEVQTAFDIFSKLDNFLLYFISINEIALSIIFCFSFSDNFIFFCSL